MRPDRIVVAEDTLEACNILLRALQEDGYFVDAFASSLDAWKALESEEKVALLITEIVFSGHQPTGFELAEFARKSHPEATIIYVTGNDWAYAIARFETNPRFMKPIAMNEFLMEVNKATARSYGSHTQ